ncbi:MAG: hypothetical protein Q8M94_00280, partial [Ignavibacteria bacterium]|nr:hypothetical protein [Ignavibacteria bacterium]
PFCKQNGLPSIYLDGCTRCSNILIFGSPSPSEAQIEEANKERQKLGLNDWEYAKYKEPKKKIEAGGQELKP